MKIWLSLVLTLCLFTLVYGEPTKKAIGLAWNQDGMDDVAGWYLYYARESEPIPREYDNSRRVDVGLLSATQPEDCPNVDSQPASQVCYKAFFLDLNIHGQGRWCFRATAYDAATNESGFSNEYCGFFGLVNPSNLRGNTQ